jgi:two-component system chemotaxis response regulator CheB
MDSLRVVVCGASAGGVSALRALVAALRPDFPAALLIVLHTAPYGRSLLPDLLRIAGKLPAEHAHHGQKIEPGHIYVAPPDRHLLVEDSHMHLWYGPKENLSRPAIDPTLRSAAAAYGQRAIGVILSGFLDDGTAGLFELKRQGGIAIVQNPEEAEHSDMPLSALQHVEVDHVARINEIAQLLNKLTDGEVRGAERMERSDRMMITPTTLTCPECRGSLEEIKAGALLEFRCRVDHRYTAESVIAAHTETQERTLWAAIVAVDEGADLMERVAGQVTADIAEQLRQRAGRNRDAAARIRKIVDELGTEPPV